MARMDRPGRNPPDRGNPMRFNPLGMARHFDQVIEHPPGNPGGVCVAASDIVRSHPAKQAHGWHGDPAIGQIAGFGHRSTERYKPGRPRSTPHALNSLNPETDFRQN